MDDRWAQLQERFATRLSQRLTDMTLAIERLHQGDTTVCDSLMRQFHSLAGIGGTYGYPGITAAALEGERLCAASIDDRRTLSPGDLHAIRSLIATIAEIHRNARDQV